MTEAPVKTPKPVKIAGLPAVSALFARDPGRVLRLHYAEGMKPTVGAFCKAMAAARKPYRLATAEELEKLAGTVLHGDILAVAEPKPLVPFEPAMAKAWAEDRKPLVVLDGIGNPHNLGAIVRTMAFFGLPRLLLSEHREQALPSDAAYRVAEGGMEYIDLFRAPSLIEALNALRKSFRVLGTLPGGGARIEDLNLDRPVTLILGNEEHGLSEPTRAACHGAVAIAGSGQIQSLNVAATAAIFIHHLARVSS